MRKQWYRLDNAALIFPAVMRKNWNNVFRVSVTLRDAVDPEVLSRAAADLLPRFPTMFVRLRTGFFWYYLETVSEALSMSPSYIGLLFRRVAGTSFLKYLTDARIAETKRLLLTTDLTLREIGQKVGIENQNTLIRTFKKTEGITPGQFRMANSSIHSQNR